MIKNLCFSVCLLVAVISVNAAKFSKSDYDALDLILGFETDIAAESFSESTPLDSWPQGGWKSYPEKKAFFDNAIVESGKFSARIEGVSDEIEEMNKMKGVVIYKNVFFGYEAEQLEMSVSLRAEAIQSASISCQFLDASGRKITNSKAEELTLQPDIWIRKTLECEIPKGSERLVLSVHSPAKSKLWVDSVSLGADGRPMSELSVKQSILDIDDEFDAGSGISIDHLTQLQIDSLERLAVIWGFLKYHHPAIKRGEYHWDYELFRCLPAILKSKSHDDLQQRLFDWVKSFDLEPDPHFEPKVEEGDIHFTADLDWMKDSRFLREDIRDILERIYQARTEEPNSFYFGLEHASYPKIPHELPYKNMDVADDAYRLLALFRYWNIVQYWFPYRNLIEPVWFSSLRPAIPKMIEADQKGDYFKALAELIAGIQDSHANYIYNIYPMGKDSHRLNAFIEKVENKWVVTGHQYNAEAKGLLMGDILLAIDDTPVDEIANEIGRYCGASNASVLARDIGRILVSGIPGEVDVRVIRDREIQTVQTSRIETKKYSFSKRHSRNSDTVEILHSDVAYLDMSKVEKEQVPSYIDAIMGKKGVIIDIRNYPSDHLVHTLAGHFVTIETEFSRFTYADPLNPGQFLFRNTDTIPAAAPHYSGKVVVLVDELSQSNSEYQTMAFQQGVNSIVIGSQTAGADGNVSRIPLPGAPGTKFSGIGVFYPDKTPTQKIGIVPDIEVRPTIQGIIEGRDEVLEVALKEILGEGVSDEEIREIAMRN